MTTILWSLGIAAALLAVDRLFLWFEARGWMYWRRSGPSRGGVTYHALELQSMFNPGAEEIQEVMYGQEEEQDESGAPPGPGDKPDDAPWVE